MGSLPVPAEVYFNDFSFDLVTYFIKRNSETVGTADGLQNKDENGWHISFLINVDIQPGDILITPNETFIISHIGYDTYNDKAELAKAYY